MLVRLRHDRERGKRTNWLLIKRHDGYERRADGEAALKQTARLPRAAPWTRSPPARAAAQAVHARQGKQLQGDAIWHSNRGQQPAQTRNACAGAEGKAAAARAQERRQPCQASSRRSFARA